MTTSIALELRSVGKRFGGIDVVRDVSLEVETGEFLTLLGASGCGKTTMLRIMAGFEKPTSGRVLITGKDVTHLPAYRRRIGMVFQSLALFPHLSVGANVGFGLTVQDLPSGERRTRVNDALQMVGLGGFESRSTSDLSGGQKQRVALARSLVTDPAVLLLDEPLSALDLQLRKQMQSELKTIQRRTGATFVFVTHDQEEALSMSDRIAVIHRGRIEQIGDAKDIYLHPATAFVGTTVGEANLFPANRRGNSYFIDALGVSIPAPPNAPLDQPIVIVRPERVLVGPRSATDVAASAEIVETTFVGTATSYMLKCGELAVRARNPFDSTRSPPQPGEKVTIGWAYEDCSIVPS